MSGIVGSNVARASGTVASPVGGGPSYGQINENITVASGKNASSVGPITVGSSYSVTVNGVYTVI